VKNLNSLSSLRRAIDHEADRQVALLLAGGRVVQETRHWNEADQMTHSLRSKEEAFDYRYFPEPDLVPLAPEAAAIEAVRAGLPLLPAARRQRVRELVAGADLDQVVTVVDLGLDDLVVAAVGVGADGRLSLARAANEAAQRPTEARELPAAAFAELIALESSGALSATQAKTVLAELLSSGGQPTEIAGRLGFQALASGDLDVVVDAIIAAHPAEWVRYLEGDEKVAQFLLGQVMRETKGRANGRLAAAAFEGRKGS
jgi:aspartyl-tRNA(Asn)/glutamyl-tRNA(Gln) amidotransferase subunit B